MSAPPSEELFLAKNRLARSCYFYHRKVNKLPDKYEGLRCRIIKLFEENNKRYGYRRIHALLVVVNKKEPKMSEKRDQDVNIQLFQKYFKNVFDGKKGPVFDDDWSLA